MDLSLLLFTLGWQHDLLGTPVWRDTLGEGMSLQTQATVALLLLVGGFQVGDGARLVNGCTSGDGNCGLGTLVPSLRAKA